MTQRPPALVAVSHGTSSPEGRLAVRGLFDAVVAAVAERYPEATPSTRLGHVDVEQPDVPTTLATLEPGEPAVIVPLLLSAGYHVHVDLAEAASDAADTGREVVIAGALGPDDRLVAVLRRRLDEAEAVSGDPVVLAVAGSSDGRAVVDCHDMAGRLAAASDGPVSIGFLSAAAPRLPEAVAAARAEHAGGRIAVSSYLLAPGYFQDLAAAAGGDLVAGPVLRHDDPAPAELVAIVLDRYETARAAASARPD